MHIMTGNLSYQIEHHLFPDLPSNRYQEIAPQVQALFDEVRPDLRHRLAAAPGRLGVEEGHPALATQRLRLQGAGQGPPSSPSRCAATKPPRGRAPPPPL